MRRSLLVAALMTTTALTPARAEAGPVLGFIQGIAAGLAGSSILGGTYLTAGFTSGVAASVGLTTGVGGFLVRTLVGLGINAIVNSLTPQPKLPNPSDQMVNFAQAVSYAEWILGRTRKGGPLGFTGFSGATDPVTGTKGRKRHYSPLLAAHPCEAIVTHYLDDTEVTLDADGLVTSGPSAGYYRIRPFLGAADQVADPALVATFDEITSSHDFAGLTGGHIWARRTSARKFSQVYPEGRQASWAPLVDGLIEVYDPRSGTTVWTRNAALLLAWWLNAYLGLPVDWDEVAIEADAADVTVTNAEGGLQPKWRIDGVISDSQTFEEQRVGLAAACDAWFYERPDGGVGFRVGRWIEPDVTLTEADFYGLQISEGAGDAPLPPGMFGQYREPANLWRETPTGTFVLDPFARAEREEVALFLVSSHNQACRVVKRLAAIRRARYRLSGTLGPVGLTLIGKRFVRVAALGIDAVFEVDQLVRTEAGWSFELSGHSVTEADFAFDAATEEPERPAFDAVSADNAVDPLTGLTATAIDGPALDIRWAAQDESLDQEVQISPSGADDWQLLEAASGADRLTWPAVVDGETYDLQGRNRTASGRVSDWSATVTVLAVANSVAPVALTAFAATLIGADVDLTFTAPADPAYFATRIWHAEYPAGHPGTPDVADAAVIVTEYGLAGNPDAFTQTAPTANRRHAYWAEPVNASGVAGPLSGPEIVDTP